MDNCTKKRWDIGWNRADFCVDHVCSGPKTCTTVRLPDQEFCLYHAIENTSDPTKLQKLRLIEESLPKYANCDDYTRYAELSVEELRAQAIEKQKQKIAEAQLKIEELVKI